MATRHYDRVLKCGCMISSDGGGGLVDCGKEKGCQYGRWMKTKDYQLHLKEIEERNQ